MHCSLLVPRDVDVKGGSEGERDEDAGGHTNYELYHLFLLVSECEKVEKNWGELSGLIIPPYTVFNIHPTGGFQHLILTTQATAESPCTCGGANVTYQLPVVIS
jgi:hypothetical protein